LVSSDWTVVLGQKCLVCCAFNASFASNLGEWLPDLCALLCVHTGAGAAPPLSLLCYTDFLEEDAELSTA
jgi:hypothetical protein